MAQLHPATARRHGIGEGDGIRISNSRGALQARAELTHDIRPDTVFLPFHYPDAESANLLTSDQVDPHSAMPEFKRALVQVSAV